MKILEVPYIVEFFFAVSTIVFVITLYAILPALLFDKRTIFKPTFINSLWERIFKNLPVRFGNTSHGNKKKELKSTLLLIDCDFETIKIYK